MCNTRFLCVATIFALGLVVSQTLAAEDPNLVGWWTFDEGSGTVAKDSSGHGNDGTLNGDPRWVSGFLDGALSFGGSGDYVDCGSDPSLDLTAWTIAFWLNATENKNYNGFVIKDLDAAENYEVLGFADGSIHLPITFDDGTRTYVNTAGGTIVGGEWAHLAYSYSPTQGRRFYKDGEMIFSDAPGGTPKASTDPLTIGNERPMTRFVNGIMDDVRIYNRLLTDAEIKQIGARFKAYDPDPVDGALAVTMPLLQWMPATFAVFHNVYLGTTAELTEADLVGPHQPFTMLYCVQGLQPGETYYWRIDEIDAAGDVQTGDVWSFVAQALTAYHPTPSDGATDASPAPNLTWLPGQTVINHHVYFGDNADAVTQGTADVDKGDCADPNFAPGALECLTTYYWRVDEIVMGGDVRPGPVWTFTTCLSIDDFEGYTDEEGSRIYETWIDGWTNDTCSQVGNLQAPFAERTIICGGEQSIPIDYNNVAPPHYSEAEREFSPTQDWTANGADTLILYVRGQAANDPAPLSVAIEDAANHRAAIAHPDAAITTATQWTEWKIPLSDFCRREYGQGQEDLRCRRGP